LEGVTARANWPLLVHPGLAKTLVLRIIFAPFCLFWRWRHGERNDQSTGMELSVMGAHDVHERLRPAEWDVYAYLIASAGEFEQNFIRDV
jgi:hypothetical protein